MDAQVIEIGDDEADEADNLRGKLVDIVDALDREIDLTWARFQRAIVSRASEK